jgi:hypothetical protein
MLAAFVCRVAESVNRSKQIRKGPYGYRSIEEKMNCLCGGKIYQVEQSRLPALETKGVVFFFSLVLVLAGQSQSERESPLPHKAGGGP